jgi:hypothetical protein
VDREFICEGDVGGCVLWYATDLERPARLHIGRSLLPGGQEFVVTSSWYDEARIDDIGADDRPPRLRRPRQRSRTTQATARETTPAAARL